MPNPGTKYLALTNLSVPRQNDPEHKTDLVQRGGTVILTAKQAEPFLQRQPPVIARVSDTQGAALLLPRQLSGPLHGPPAGARPDPPGSSAIQVLQEAPPEMSEPGPGDESNGDALDIPPGTRVAAGV